MERAGVPVSCKLRVLNASLEILKSSQLLVIVTPNSWSLGCFSLALLTVMSMLVVIVLM